MPEPEGDVLRDVVDIFVGDARSRLVYSTYLGGKGLEQMGDPRSR